MKLSKIQLLAGITIGLLFPFVASANIATPWFATSSDHGYISPTPINGNNPWIVVHGILSTASSTFTVAPFFSSLGAGTAEIGLGGLLYSSATTTASCGGSVSCSTFTIFGSSPVTITGNDSGTVTAVTATNPLFSSGGATPNITTLFSTTTTFGLGNNGILMTGATGIPFSQATSSAINLSISGSAGSVANSVTFNSGGAGGASPQVFNGSSAETISYNTIGAQVAGSYDAVITATTPIIRTANNLTFVGLATTSQPTDSQLLESNGGAGVFGVATGTITCTGSASCTTTGLSVIGGNLTISASGGSSGLATSSPIASSNLLEYSSNGAGSAFGVATTSATINNGLTGTLTTINSQTQTIGLASQSAGTVLGSVTASVPTGIATSSLFGTGTGGQVLAWNNGVPQWVATSSINNGVTSVATNYSMTGGPITTTGTLAVATSSLYTGSTGQVPYFSGANTLIGTSSLTIGTNQNLKNANGDTLGEQASYTVSTTTRTGDYTDLQSAINALPATGGLIFVRCGTYTITATTSIKVAGTIIEGSGTCTQFNFDGGAVSSAIDMNAAGLTNIQLLNFYVHNTNAAYKGIGINASNTPILIVRGVKIDKTATSTSITDTANDTFYNDFSDMDLRDNTTCIQIGGKNTAGTNSNPVNENTMSQIRCAPTSGNKGFGYYIDANSANGAQDWTFTNIDSEPTGAATGITAIYVNNGVDIAFINPYVEGNATAWNLTANSQRVTFYGGEFVSNTTYTNNGSNNQWLGTDKEGLAYQFIMASSTIADVSGNDATVNDLSFTGNTNFAKTGSAISIVYANSTDSGIPLQITNPGTGTSTQIIASGTGDAFEVDSSAHDSTPTLITASGNISIGSTTPGSVLSIGNTTKTTGINFSLATSTFTNVGGINLTTGCFAISGVCISGSSGGSSGIGDPFTHSSVWGQTTSATSTLLSLTGSPYSLVASSSVAFGNGTSTLYINSTTGQLSFGTNNLPAATQFVTIASTSASAFSVQDGFGSQDVNIQTASTTGPIFAVEATTTGNPILFSEDQYGHLTASSTGATPTVGTCGTSPSFTTNSNDATGEVTFGTGSVTACTITFATAYSVTPNVFITNEWSLATTSSVTAHSTTAFTVTTSASAGGAKFQYYVLMP